MAAPSYSSGQVAKSVNPSNGTGFVYYPDGKVACSISSASDYQNSHYSFDKSKKSTVLLALDEHLVGFVTSTSRPSGAARRADGSGISVTMLALSKLGGILSKDEVILKEWVWGSQKSPLNEEISIALNEYLVFTLRSLTSASLVFSCEGVTHLMDLSVKEKRTQPTYLATAKRGPGGRLLPSLPNYQSLKQRTVDFNQSMKAQNNKIHPKSENLSDMVSDIVAGLERAFEGVDERMACSPSPGTTWKGEALTKTLNEVPKIPSMGTESGPFVGLGKDIYTAAQGGDLEALHKASLPAHLVGPGGAWKNNVEVTRSLQRLNPVLKPGKVLKFNSGRYSTLMVANPALVTPQNPTGMVMPEGRPIELLKWTTLREFTILASTGAVYKPPSSASSASTPAANTYGSEVLVCLVGRTGDPAFADYSHIAAVANLSPSPGIRLCKVEVGDCSDVLSEMEIRSLPCFLVLAPGAGGVLRSMYSGLLGGRRSAGAGGGGGGGRPQVLLIEPTAKYQIALERTLKNEGCDSSLCLSLGQAAERLQILSSSQPGSSPPVFDLVLVSSTVDLRDLGALLKKLQQHTTSGRTVIAGLVTVLGEAGASNLKLGQWDAKTFTSTQIEALLPPDLASAAAAAVQSPVKGASIKALLARVKRGGEEALELGLTPDTLNAKVAALRDAAAAAGGGGAEIAGGAGGAGGPLKQRRIPLAVEDVRLHGTSLVRA